MHKLEIGLVVTICIALTGVLSSDIQGQEDEHQEASRALTLGDRFPQIGDRANWLKGTPVGTYEEGHIYVIDLWATWCSPCVAMMPHTSKVAELYEPHGVTVIGVALDPRTATPTATFVEENQDLMRYSVCEDIDGQLQADFLQRTGTAAIPSVFIVNKQGVLAWIGHPKDMSGPLAEIVLDTYDLESAIATRRSTARAEVSGNSTRTTPSNRNVDTNALFERLWEVGDTDGDGQLNTDELANARSESGRIILDPGRLPAIDTNEDNLLSREEIQAYSDRRIGRDQQREPMPDSDQGERAPAVGSDRTSAARAFADQDGPAIIAIAMAMMGNEARRVNALGMLGKGHYYDGDFDKCREAFESIVETEGHFQVQVLCGAAEFLAVAYEDNPSRNLKLAIELGEQALTIRSGQQWPAHGSLVFVLDVVDRYMQGNVDGDMADLEFFESKLSDYEDLRETRPRENSSTQRNRVTVLGR